MQTQTQIAAWVTPGTRARIKALAAQRGLSVSCLLGELIDEALAELPDGHVEHESRDEPRREYLTVRLRPGDVKLIGRRARGRRMKSATYIAALVGLRVQLMSKVPF